MTARPRLLLAVLLAASFLLAALDAGERSPFAPLRSAVVAVLGPADAAAGRVAGSAGDAVGGVGDLVDRSELRRLREENARLREQVASARADARRSTEWRELLQLAEAGGWTLAPARVVGAGGALGFERTVTLDVGAGDGVESGQTVLAGPGLLGRTVAVGRWTSVVLVLDDPAFGVGARLAGTGALGLARGEGGTLRWTLVGAGPVSAGDVLLTSGSDTFVPDVPVGTVRETAPAEGGLTTTATVEPFVDLSRLELVGVVLDAPRSTARPPVAPGS